jgi:beta-glucuronidase
VLRQQSFLMIIHVMIVRVTLCLLFAAMLAVPLHASTRVALNGSWRFRIDRNEEGETQGWNITLPAATDVVRVPHSWNIGTYDDYEGVAWYFRTLALSPAVRGEHVELHFAATFYKSRVWLNGKLLGAHEGGYTPYWFDISSALRPGENFLAVELDNRPTAQTIPGFALRLREGHRIWYDWWHYGGLVRDVWLTINQDGLIRRQRITSTITANEAQVTTNVFLDNVSRGKQDFHLTATAYSPNGTVAGKPETTTVTAVPGSSAVQLKLSIQHPELWNLDHPALYRMAVELREGHGQLLDTRENSFGLRTVEIRDRHLFLNGDRVRLTGMTRHEDSPWEGLAETAGTIKNDYDALEQLHVRLTRPVHYPQHELILDYADRHGILLIPEIPMWQFSEDQMKAPKVISLARQMFQEMIEEDENHPSIFAWSVCNESEATTKGGRAYIDTMRDWIYQLDPGRFVSYADNDIAGGPDPETEAANDVDFIMMNAYFGTWSGNQEDLVPRLQQIGRDYPTKMVIISEFGYPGLFSPDSAAADKIRIRTIENQLEQFQKFDFVAGAIFWCYQDYKSHQNLWPGHTEGYVDHGLVDEYRQRRPSFWIWEKRNQPVVFSNEKWTYDNKGNRVGFEVDLSGRPLDEMPSYPLTDSVVRWELRDHDGNLLARGEQPVPDLRQPVFVRGAWDAKPSLPLHLQITFLDAKGDAEGTTVLDVYPANSGGQNIEDMNQTPH